MFEKCFVKWKNQWKRDYLLIRMHSQGFNLSPKRNLLEIKKKGDNPRRIQQGPRGTGQCQGVRVFSGYDKTKARRAKLRSQTALFCLFVFTSLFLRRLHCFSPRHYLCANTGSSVISRFISSVSVLCTFHNYFSPLLSSFFFALLLISFIIISPLTFVVWKTSRRFLLQFYNTCRCFTRDLKVMFVILLFVISTFQVQFFWVKNKTHFRLENKICIFW